MKFVLKNQNPVKNIHSYYQGVINVEEVDLGGGLKKHLIIDLEEMAELAKWIDGLAYEVDIKGNPAHPDYYEVIILD